MTESAGKRIRVTKPLCDWYMAHPGVIRRADDVAAELGLNPRSAMTSAGILYNRGILQKGTTRAEYVYRGGKAQTHDVPYRKPIQIGTLLECVGRTEVGDAVIKDEEGIIYVVRPVS